MKKLAFLSVLFFLSVTVFGQRPSPQVFQFFIQDGDTVMYMPLKSAYIVDYKIFKSEKDKKKYKRLVRYVKKVYPYARLAGDRLRYYDDTLRSIESDRARKKFMKRVEREIRSEYEGDLKNLTIRQGKILVKLIDRETNNSSYALLQELRGAVSAALWQGVGRVFGYNLKTKYDPKGKDKEIEYVVQLIELGVI